MAPIVDYNGARYDLNEREGRIVKAVFRGARRVSAQSQARAPARKIRGEDYILLDREHQQGRYSERDLLIPFARTHLDVEWIDCTTPSLLTSESGYMMPQRGFVDFLRLIRTGRAFDGNGKLVDPERLKELANEITEVRDPLRGEWFDAQYGNGTMQYYLIKKDGTAELRTEPLEDYLMGNKAPGISLKSWLKTANSQGLPTRKTAKGRLYYSGPREGAVPGFFASSDWAYFICDGNPAVVHDGRIGVRVVRLKE